jgi:hypothetical protein
LSLADLIAWALLALLIGWLAFVLWCTYELTLDDLRRAGVVPGSAGRRRWDDVNPRRGRPGERSARERPPEDPG